MVALVARAAVAPLVKSAAKSPTGFEPQAQNSDALVQDFDTRRGHQLMAEECKLLIFLAPQVGFEPTTLRLTAPEIWFSGIWRCVATRCDRMRYLALCPVLSAVWADPMTGSESAAVRPVVTNF